MANRIYSSVINYKYGVLENTREGFYLKQFLLLI